MFSWVRRLVYGGVWRFIFLKKFRLRSFLPNFIEENFFNLMGENFQGYPTAEGYGAIWARWMGFSVSGFFGNMTKAGWEIVVMGVRLYLENHNHWHYCGP